MHFRAKKSFSYKLEDGRERRVPRGWIGELPDEIAEAAIADGKGVNASADGQTQQTSEKLDDLDDLDDMTHAELVAVAEERGVQFKKNDSKAEIAAAIKAHK